MLKFFSRLQAFFFFFNTYIALVFMKTTRSPSLQKARTAFSPFSDFVCSLFVLDQMQQHQQRGYMRQRPSRYSPRCVGASRRTRVRRR